MTKKIKLIPLGGLGEIGAMNCMVYETHTDAILVDCGSMFPDADTMGVDLIIPDFSYIDSIKHKLRGVVFTHGHEDHIGSIPFLLRKISLPVYGTPFTLGLIRKKLEEHGLENTTLIPFTPGDRIEVGPFGIETVHVNHSIVNASALAIETAMGYIVHLTDWKIDKKPILGETTDLKKFSRIGKKGVLVMLSDSTNVDSPGNTLSESEVAKKLYCIINTHSERVIVTLFASNVQRVQVLVDIAKKTGRSVSFVGRSMKENTEIAHQLGLLSLDGVDIVDVEDIGKLDPSKVMVLVTGTQGEPRSVLTRMAFSAFKPFAIRAGDLVLFSSKIIPGNEKNIFHVINSLCRHGARVYYESFHDIHSSGHAHQEELREAFKRFSPKYLIPIHGEFRHMLKHADLAKKWGLKKNHAIIVENGQTMTFENGDFVGGDPVEIGRTFVDGTGVGDVGDAVIRDRKQLADTGIVICVLMLDRKSGEIIRGPELISRGFSEDADSRLMEGAKKCILDFLDEINFEERTDLAEVQEEVRQALRRFFKRQVDRKPMVIPVISEM